MPERILLTGDRGYIGTIMAQMLCDLGYEVIGLDTGYFAGCLLEPVPQFYSQISKDIRAVSAEDLKGIDAVIHLAGLSNDPLGSLAPHLTNEINLVATLELARLARAASVQRFIYASSQSMYGIARGDCDLDEDTSEKNPITDYARTKWDAEVGLRSMQSPEFTVVCMRPSTVFGWSPRLRCDIVFNNLVACAFTTGRIEIKSDGTPWRPVVHVRDVCSAFIAGLEAPANLVGGRAYNVGIPDGNFTVRDLAEVAQRSVPGSELTFTGEHGSDSRTYRVSFDRILSELGEWFSPSWTLEKGAAELVNNFRRIGFTEEQFRGHATTRLSQLQYLVDNERVDASLRWNHAGRSLS